MKNKSASQFEPRRRARRRALQALYQWRLTGQDAGDIIAQFREFQDFSNVDVELFANLVTVLDKLLPVAHIKLLNSPGPDQQGSNKVRLQVITGTNRRIVHAHSVNMWNMFSDIAQFVGTGHREQGPQTRQVS